MKILERKLLDGKTTTLKHSCKNDKAMKELKSFPLNLVLSVSLKKPHDNLICFLKSTHFTLILLIFGSVYLEEFFFHIWPGPFSTSGSCAIPTEGALLDLNSLKQSGISTVLWLESPKFMTLFISVCVWSH